MLSVPKYNVNPETSKILKSLKIKAPKKVLEIEKIR